MHATFSRKLFDLQVMRICGFVLCASLLASCGGPVPTQEEIKQDTRDNRAAQLVRVADTTREGGDFSNAMQLYARAAAMRLDWAVPLKRLGETAIVAGQFARARNAYQKASNIDPSDIENHLGIGRVDLKTGEYDSALASFETAARLDPEDNRGHNGAGVTLDLDLGSDPLMIDLMDGEMHVLETRRQNLDRQDSIIRERISKQSAIIRGHRAKRIAIEKRLALLQDEFGMMSKLLKKGLVAKNRVLSVERSIVDSEGEFQDLAANIAEAGDEIAKLEMERALSMDRHQRDVAAEIQETNERMAEVAEQIRAAKDVLARTVIKAPEDGVVVALRHHTLGGVVQAGEPILDIVPNHDQHIIELRINPNDVDVIFPGQRARVRLAAYNARTSPMIEGTVINVSPDKTSDPVTGSTFFTGRVMPDIGTLESIPSLMSGMQAEVFIMTAERTVLDYLLDPLFRSIDRAGRES